MFPGARGAGVDAIDLDLAQAALERVLENESPLFALELEGLTDIPQARAVLDRIVRGDSVYAGSAGHPERVRRALNALLDRCILVREARGRYAFEEPLLREHLLRPYGG